MASLVAYRFSVVTTLSRSISAIEHNLAKYGFAGRCARVRASDIPVLEIRQQRDAERRIGQVRSAIARDYSSVATSVVGADRGAADSVVGIQPLPAQATRYFRRVFQADHRSIRSLVRRDAQPFQRPRRADRIRRGRISESGDDLQISPVQGRGP